MPTQKEMRAIKAKEKTFRIIFTNPNNQDQKLHVTEFAKSEAEAIKNAKKTKLNDEGRKVLTKVTIASN